MEASRLGPAVKHRRSELGITLAQLAEASGVSRGTLSRIENDSLSTSLANALAIAKALSIEINELLGDSSATLTKADEVTTFTDSSGVVRSSLALPAPGVELLSFRVPAGATSAEFASHRERTLEVLTVLQGRLVYSVADNEYNLSEADTLTVRADRPHRFRNPGSKESLLHMLIVSPR